jgi:hypothetical protein
MITRGKNMTDQAWLLEVLAALDFGRPIENIELSDTWKEAF